MEKITLLLMCNGALLILHDFGINEIFFFFLPDWKTHPDPKVATTLYRKEILRLHETGKPLLMCMDLRTCAEEQERQLINFYKQRNVEWACPVKCQLEGTA